MAQDDRKGQPPSTRGRAPAPSAPDTPDARHMNAPPPPEAPETAEPAAPEAQPGEAMEGDGTTDDAAGEELEQIEESESDRLRREIEEARQSLQAKETALARVEAQRLAAEATARMVEDYAKELPALTASEEGLEQYRLAETSFLGKFLDEPTMQKIADAAANRQEEIDALRRKIEQTAGKAQERKRDLEAAKGTAAAAKGRADALKRPAASIRDRLKAAEATRTEAQKATDEGNYALAYYLIMDDGRLAELVRAEPRIIPPSDLEKAISEAAAGQREAEQRAAALESEVKGLDAALQTDRARLAALEAKFEAGVRDSLAALNPKPAEAA
jgi:hypothetical protein